MAGKAIYSDLQTDKSPRPSKVCYFMSAPRIALFTGNYNHIRDGVSNTLNRLVAWLDQRGYQVLVFAPWTPEPAMDHAGQLVPVYAIPAPGRPEYRISLGMRAAEKARLDDFRPDLIHIATPDVLGLQALRYARRRGTPVVSSYHTHFSSYLKYYKLGWMESSLWSYLRWFYRNCRQLYVPTSSAVEELQKAGVQTDMRIWSRGVDVQLFHPRKRDEQWRSQLGFKPDDIVVHFVSRLVWEKNLDVVAKVFEQLMQQNRQIKTLVTGDGPAREALQKRLGNTVFLGFLTGEALARAYASSDLFFNPSDTETFGNVTLEAMACGLPAVVADAQGSRSLVQHTENGFVCDANDTHCFGNHLLGLAGDGQLRRNMAMQARSKSEQYDWNRIFENLVYCYSEVLGRV